MIMYSRSRSGRWDARPACPRMTKAASHHSPPVHSFPSLRELRLMSETCSSGERTVPVMELPGAQIVGTRRIAEHIAHATGPPLWPEDDALQQGAQLMASWLDRCTHCLLSLPTLCSPSTADHRPSTDTALAGQHLGVASSFLTLAPPGCCLCCCLLIECSLHTDN